MMLTSWDGDKFYLQYYDMDTILGLDNTGAVTKDVDIERESVDSQGKQQFNTAKSLLWILVENCFAEEIKELYHALRDSKYYSIDRCWQAFYGDFISKIPKTAYNHDMRFRYIDIDESERSQYMFVCNGSQEKRLKQWITNRLIFMDSLYNYSKEFFPTTAGMRANKMGEAVLRLKTFTPQYVTVSFQDGVTQTLKCRPEEYTEFRGNITTSADQEIFISNAPYLKEIDNIRSLNISRLFLENATRITKLDCSSSTSLKDLSLGNNPLLRELNCSACSILGTSESGGKLDLSKCINLTSVNCSQTKITSVLLYSDGGFLQSFDAHDCSLLASVNFQNQNSLTNINIDNCPSISSFTMNSCNMITEFKLPDTELEMLNISNCSGLESLEISGSSNFRVMKIEYCDKLTNLKIEDLTSSGQNAIEEINLATLNKIETLTINNAPYTSKLRLPINNCISKFYVTNTGIKTINYGEISTSSTSFDMKNLKNLLDLRLKNNRYVESITNLEYTANSGYELFYGCSALQSVDGNLTLGGSITRMFYACNNITSFPTMDLNNVTSAEYVFTYCYKMKMSYLPTFIDSFGVNSKNTSFSCLFYGADCGKDENYVLPSKLITYAKFPKLTNCYRMFANTRIVGEVPGDLFGDPSDTSSITSIDFIFSSTTVASMGGNLLKPLKNLQSAQNLFWGTSTANITIPDDFFVNNKKLSNAARMFWGTKITGAVKKSWFDSLPALTNAQLMFYNSSIGNNEPLPDELLVNNTLLNDISGMFASCKNISGPLPDNLLGGNGTKDMAITYARATFNGCSNITGNVPLNFFKRCPNLINIGTYNWTLYSTNYSINTGCFANTGLNTPIKTDDYGYSIYRYNTKLQNADYVFTGTNITGDIPEKMFATNNNLQYIRGHFQNCKQLSGKLKTNLINGNTKLKSIDFLFDGCTGITDTNGVPEGFLYNLSNLESAKAVFRNMVGLSGSISKTIFRDTINVKYLDSFFEGCYNLNGSIPAPTYTTEYDVEPTTINVNEWLIDNNVNVTSRTSNSVEFTTLVSHSGVYYQLPLSLIGKKVAISCSEISEYCEYAIVDKTNNTTLARCIFGSSLSQQITIPSNLNTSDLVLTVRRRDDAQSSSCTCTGMRLYIESTSSEYLIYNLDTPGLFCNCTKLISLNNFFKQCRKIEGVIPDHLLRNLRNLLYAKGLFYNCNKLTGGYPSLLFAKNDSLIDISEIFFHCNKLSGYIDAKMFKNCYSLQNITSAWAYNPGLVKDPDPDNVFCLPDTLFSACPLVKADSVFEGDTNLTGNLPPNLFKGKSKLSTLAECFAYTGVGGIVYSTFIDGCEALSSVHCLFDTTKITGIEYSPSDAKYFFTKNMKYLTDVIGFARNCSSLVGDVPLFDYHPKASKTGCYYNSTKINNYSSLTA